MSVVWNNAKELLRLMEGYHKTIQITILRFFFPYITSHLKPLCSTYTLLSESNEL
jgi:hypothetical protein